MPTCLQCQRPLVGRRDKRYCSSVCRSGFNNRRIKDRQRVQQEQEKALHKNREILYDLLIRKGQSVVDRTTLVQHGFHFSCFSSCVRLKDQHLFFCYDLYYVPLENDYFALDRSDRSNKTDARDPGLQSYSLW